MVERLQAMIDAAMSLGELWSVILLLAGLITYGIARLMLRRYERRFAFISGSVFPGIKPIPPGGTPSGEVPPVAPGAYLALLNDYPDRAPHTLIRGPSGAGKTTFARALLAQRGGLVAILTPKPDDDWCGGAITIDDDASFRSLAAAFLVLEGEIKRRLVESKQGVMHGEQLTVVLDDYPVLAGEIGEQAARTLKLAARLGRSLRVRLILLSQSTRVKSVGLEGEGDTLENLQVVELARGGKAQLLADGATLPLDIRPIPPIAARLDLTGRVFPLVREHQYTGMEVAFSSPVTGIPSVTSDDTAPGVTEPAAPLSSIPPTDGIDDEVIRVLIAAGWSKNQIAGKMRSGSKQARLARIRAALEVAPVDAG